MWEPLGCQYNTIHIKLITYVAKLTFSNVQLDFMDGLDDLVGIKRTRLRKDLKRLRLTSRIRVAQ